MSDLKSSAHSFTTGIFIRARKRNHASGYDSIDIGDQRLNAPELLSWMAALDDASLMRVMDFVRAIVRIKEGHGMEDIR
jgi:hypothetical protein